MEGNGMAGRMMPGMLGLEMQLHHQPHQHGRHQTPAPPTLQQLMFASPGQVHHDLEADRNLAVAPKHVYTFGGGTKVKPARSSEDEPSTAYGEECGGGAGGIMELGANHQQQQRGLAPSSSASPTTSPWQRMKWTDTMVRLLIMVVYCVGDDGVGADGGGAHHTGKAGKKGASAAASGAAAPSPAGLLQLQQQQQQKKGKWKSVSRAMMEKGYYVSPQQCEDKFNDLNKRYKRVNDILGKGTACRVVENQALLDAMDHLSPKAKEEVRKLLNSKHLFFREMCAYHRSCAVSAANAGAAAGGEAASALQSHHLQSCEALVPSDSSQPPPLPLQQQQRTPSAVGIPPAALISARGEEGDAGLRMKVGQEEDGMVGGDDDEEDDDEDDYEDEDDLDEDEEPAGRGGNEIGYHERRRHLRGPGVHGDEEEEEDSKEEGSLSLQAAGGYKRKRSASNSPFSRSPSQQQQQQLLRVELAALTGTAEQQRQWLRWRAVELEEKRVNYGRRSLELERRRFKWLRFSGNKEREMERAKLENERLSLENERMLLLLRHKELELSSEYGGGGGGGGGEAELLHNSSSSPPVPNMAQSTSAT